jgi:hypothetical protein
MRRKRWGTVALALCIAFGVAAAAIGGAGRAPRANQVEATITFTHLKLKTRFCEGPEGEFGEQLVRGRGTSTGSPRLTGNVTVRVRLLNESASGESFERGTLVIRDPETGKKKVAARVADAGVEEIFQGSLVGRVGNQRLFANWRVTFEAGFPTAEIGGVAPDGRLPAVAISGRCTGPFEETEITPLGAAAGRLTSTDRIGWLRR